MNKYQRERIYPNKAARQFLNQAMGNSRVMYNQLLKKCNSQYEAYKADPVNNPKPKSLRLNLGLKL